MARSEVRSPFPTFARLWSWIRSRRRPRVRMTGRRWLVIVLVVTLPIGLAGVLRWRSANFREVAEEEARALAGISGTPSGHEGDRVHDFRDVGGRELDDREVAELRWHAKRKQKYLEASRRPWLPVGWGIDCDPRQKL